MHSVFAGFRAVLGALLVLSVAAGLAHAQSAAPLTLTEALRRVEAGSPHIAAAEASVRAAEGRARQAGYSPNPQARLEVENALGSGPYEGLESSEATLAIGQTLELGGKRRARSNAALAEVAVARAQLAIARAEAASEVRGAYAEAVAASERLALTEDAVTRATELARIAAKLVEEGREPPLRAYRALSAAGEAAAARDAARAEAAATTRALAGLLGDVGGAYALSDADAFGSPPAVVLDPTEALDVKLAELELAAARARVDLERTGRVSDLIVEGGVRHFRGSGDTAFVAGVSMPIPIRNRNQGSIAAAQAEASGAEARRNLALAHATRAIRDAQAALAAADSRLKTLRDFSLPQSQEAVRLARLGYQEGEFNLLDVLDAEDALAQARQGLIDAELARAKALAALERAAAQ